MLQLVKRAMDSDAEAFLELMEQNSLAMYKVARGILKNDEDIADAVQDTILTCFEKINTLKKPEYFKTWMIRILINECNQILRHYRNLDLPDDFPDIPYQDMSMAEFEFKEMLGSIEEKYRIVLVLFYVEGLKTKEIAEILDMNENTVKTRIARAKEQLRQSYLKENDTPQVPNRSHQVLRTGEAEKQQMKGAVWRSGEAVRKETKEAETKKAGTKEGFRERDKKESKYQVKGARFHEERTAGKSKIVHRITAG